MQMCNVEVKLRAYIPTEVVYAPTLKFISNFPFIQAAIGAFNGNNRGFSYSDGDSKAELVGSFTIEDNSFDDITSVT